MKRFRERNVALLGVTSLVVIVALIAIALDFTNLPLVNHNRTYQADFVDSGGLAKGDVVAVAGVNVGQITSLGLDGTHVRVSFRVRASLHLPAGTGAAAKVLSPIGTEYLELEPAGTGALAGPIPLARTTVPFTVVDALSQLSTDTSNFDIPKLEKALTVGAQDLAGTPASVTASALAGLDRFSQVLAGRQSQLATIVSQGSQLAGALSAKSGQLVDLLGKGDLLLQVLQQQRGAITQLLTGTTSLATQVSTVLATHHDQLHSLLTSFSTVAALLSKDSASIGQALPVLDAVSRYTANSTGSGPFVDAVVPTLLIPDNLIAACSPTASPSPYPSANPQVGCRP